jgi:hypothetical protein
VRRPRRPGRGRDAVADRPAAGCGVPQRRRSRLGARQRSGADFGLQHRSLRAWIRRVTGRPCQSKSCRWRSYRLCTTADRIPQSGQAAILPREAATMMRPSGTGRICRTSKPVGMRDSRCLSMAGLNGEGQSPPHLTSGFRPAIQQHGKCGRTKNRLAASASSLAESRKSIVWPRLSTARYRDIQRLFNRT